jgi:ectoine hydroxylase-related dioxygenase (phytanoyl-CoA dioxygenase family)
MHQIIQVQPGSGAQGLHRDAGVFAWDTKVLGLEVEISTIWALHDFTEEVGATRIVRHNGLCFFHLSLLILDVII